MGKLFPEILPAQCSRMKEPPIMEWGSSKRFGVKSSEPRLPPGQRVGGGSIYTNPEHRQQQQVGAPCLPFCESAAPRFWKYCAFAPRCQSTGGGETRGLPFDGCGGRRGQNGAKMKYLLCQQKTGCIGCVFLEFGTGHVALVLQHARNIN